MSVSGNKLAQRVFDVARIRDDPQEMMALVRDALRYRWLRDEAEQEGLKRPMCIGVAIIDDKPNCAGNFDVTGWACTYGLDADNLIDDGMRKTALRRLSEANDELGLDY